MQWYKGKRPRILQGLTTPDGQSRGEEYFDVAAKYHVAHVRPLYTRYQIARVHQFQFLEAICSNVGKSHHHLIECNIDGRPDSTDKFREMLTKGSSVNWRKQLKVRHSLSVKKGDWLLEDQLSYRLNFSLQHCPINHLSATRLRNRNHLSATLADRVETHKMF